MDGNAPKTPEAATKTGPMMLVTTPGQNVDGGKKKARTNKGGDGGGGDIPTSTKTLGRNNIPVLKPEPRRMAQPKPKSKSYPPGGGGPGGGRRGSVSVAERSGCPSLEEMFHLIFLLVAMGFLLVYLREVTQPFIVSVFLMYLFRPLADGVEACFRDRCCAAPRNVDDEEAQREPLMNGYNRADEEEDEENKRTAGSSGVVCCSRHCAAYSGRVLGTAISVIFSLLFMVGVAMVVVHVRWLLLSCCLVVVV